MRFILNVIWLVFSGIWMALGYAFVGLLLCCTIVLLPFGLQLFKIAAYVLWPFGRSVVKTRQGPGVSTLGNLIWLPVGLFLAVGHLVSAALCAVTLIGIPFAIANVKMIGISLTPFGREIVSNGDITDALRSHRLSATDVVTAPSR